MRRAHARGTPDAHAVTPPPSAGYVSGKTGLRALQNEIRESLRAASTAAVEKGEASQFLGNAWSQSPGEPQCFAVIKSTGGVSELDVQRVRARWASVPLTHAAQWLDVHEDALLASSLFKESVAKLADPESASGVMTDSAQVMVATQAELKAVFPWFIIMFCLAHTLNLMMLDISRMPSMDSFVSLGKALIVATMGPTLRSMYVKACSTVTPSNLRLSRFVRTRFSSTYNALWRLQLNKDRLVHMVPDATEKLEKLEATARRCAQRHVARAERGDSVSVELKEKRKVARRHLKTFVRVVNDRSFWETLPSICKSLEPIADTLNRVESDRCYLTSMWFHLNDLYLELQKETADVPAAMRRDVLHGFLGRYRFAWTPTAVLGVVLNVCEWEYLREMGGVGPEEMDVVYRAYLELFSKRSDDEQAEALRELKSFLASTGPTRGFTVLPKQTLFDVFSDPDMVARVPHVCYAGRRVAHYTVNQCKVERLFSVVSQHETDTERASMSRENRDALECVQSMLRLNPTLTGAASMEVEGEADEAEVGEAGGAAKKRRKMRPIVWHAEKSFTPGVLMRATIDKGLGYVPLDDGRKLLPLIPPESETFKSAVDRVQASARARKLDLIVVDPRCAQRALLVMTRAARSRVVATPEACKWLGKVYWGEWGGKWYEGFVSHYFTASKLGRVSARHVMCHAEETGAGEPWVRVVFCDGDKEDYNLKELEDNLLTEDAFLAGDFVDA